MKAANDKDLQLAAFSDEELLAECARRGLPERQQLLEELRSAVDSGDLAEGEAAIYADFADALARLCNEFLPS